MQQDRIATAPKTAGTRGTWLTAGLLASTALVAFASSATAQGGSVQIDWEALDAMGAAPRGPTPIVDHTGAFQRPAQRVGLPRFHGLPVQSPFAGRTRHPGAQAALYYPQPRMLPSGRELRSALTVGAMPRQTARPPVARPIPPYARAGGAPFHAMPSHAASARVMLPVGVTAGTVPVPGVRPAVARQAPSPPQHPAQQPRFAVAAAAQIPGVAPVIPGFAPPPIYPAISSLVAPATAPTVNPAWPARAILPVNAPVYTARQHTMRLSPTRMGMVPASSYLLAQSRAPAQMALFGGRPIPQAPLIVTASHGIPPYGLLPPPDRAPRSHLEAPVRAMVAGSRAPGARGVSLLSLASAPPAYYGGGPLIISGSSGNRAAPSRALAQPPLRSVAMPSHRPSRGKPAPELTSRLEPGFGGALGAPAANVAPPVDRAVAAGLPTSGPLVISSATVRPAAPRPARRSVARKPKSARKPAVPAPPPTPAPTAAPQPPASAAPPPAPPAPAPPAPAETGATPPPMTADTSATTFSDNSGMPATGNGSALVSVPKAPDSSAPAAPAPIAAAAPPPTARPAGVTGSTRAREVREQAATITPPQVVATPPPAPPPPAAGDLIQGTVLFAEGATELSESARVQLAAVADQLQVDESTRVQLRAYASSNDDDPSRARRVSLSRALEVRGFLIERGVKSTRMDVRALGNRAETGSRDRVDIVTAQ